MMSYLITNNLDRHRFEADVDGHVAVLDYHQEGRFVTFLHTEVPQELGGRGVGAALAKAGLEYALQQGSQVVPKCAFVASYMKKHPEFAHLLASES